MKAIRQSSLLWIGVLATALIARLIVLLSLRGDLAIRVPLLDSLYYMTTASDLAHGKGWPPGPHFLAPIYPFLLSGLFRLVPARVEAVQWAQLVMGLATTSLVYLSARRISSVAALAAGLLYALCGPAIAYENQVLLESFLAFCLAGLIWLIGRDGSPSVSASGLGGLAVGLAAAARPTYALLLPLVLVLILRSEASGSRRVRSLVLALIGFAFIVVPPSYRNLRETGRLSFVTTSGGINFYIGNHAGAKGIYSVPPGILQEKDPTGTRSASQMAGRTLTADEASRFFARLGWAFLVEHPGAAARLWLRKAGYMISPDEVPQIESVGELCGAHLSLRLFCLIGFPVLFLMALLGVAGRGRPSRTRLVSVAVLVAGAFSHLVFFSTGRYRAPLLPPLAILAGSGIAAGVEAARDRGRAAIRRVWPLGLGVLLLLAAPRYDRKAAHAWAKHQAGIRYERLGTYRAAELMYREALAADSTLGESWHNLAACEVREGRTAEAMTHYTKALGYLGENPVTLYNLAILYGGLGMDERALDFFDRAIRADPADLAVRVDRGVALYRLGRRQEAFGEWRQVAALSPGEPTLLQTLARLTSLGAPLPPDLNRISRNP